jgi:hypothetical protein
MQIRGECSVRSDSIVPEAFNIWSGNQRAGVDISPRARIATHRKQMPLYQIDFDIKKNSLPERIGRTILKSWQNRRSAAFMSSIIG